MPTTSDYLTQLQTDKQTLATNINEKGVSTTGEETFTELASMVSQIQTGGGDISKYFVDDIGTSKDILRLFKKIPEFSFNGDTCDSMFKNCTNLEEVSLGDFDTSGVTSFAYMFQNCHSLKRLDLSSFDTSYVIAGTFTSMFQDCESLEEITIGNWDMTYATTLNSMFRNCSSLESLDLSSWGMSSVGNFAYMFQNCSSLKSINLSNFDITSGFSSSSLTSNTFTGCNALEELDMRSFDFTKVTGSALRNFVSGIPVNCLVIVEDTTQKTYLNTNASRLLNVKTKDEIIG